MQITQIFESKRVNDEWKMDANGLLRLLEEINAFLENIDKKKIGNLFKAFAKGPKRMKVLNQSWH